MTDIDRREHLLAAKLRYLAREAFSCDGTASGFRGGASLVADDGRGFVLLDDDPARSLGRALVWARRSHIADLHVVVDADEHASVGDLGLADGASRPDAAGVLARRAGWFRNPPTVWRLHDAVAERATAALFPALAAPPPEAELFGAVMAELGLDVVLEHGVLLGEVAGLEVARVEADVDGEAHLRVGVGRFDQEAAAIVRVHATDEDALVAIRDLVLEHRLSSLPHHLNRLQPERLLRHRLLAEPGLVGAASLDAAAAALPRRDLKEFAPAVAVGVDRAGEPMVAVCASGIDLDALPAAADARALHRPDAKLVLVVPERDRHPITIALAAEVAPAAEVVVAPADWTPGATGHG